jgi:uncharacterized protein YyaL (SSP411 family)
MAESEPSEKDFAPEIIADSCEKIARAYDSENGGLGQAPKFPNAGVYELFLRYYSESGEERYLTMIAHTLTKMAQGGIYDHLGGGFHRYSVDAKWLVPHFEKMLYDNAQLLRIYSQAYVITREPLYKAVVEESARYLLREMHHPEGGFYSTQDADSEGEEGKFFVWALAEVEALLGAEDAEVFARMYDITAEGNFEEKNILHPILSVDQASKFFRKEKPAIQALIARSKQKLFAAREKRIKPFRDEKIIAAWNGLALSGLAEAIKITGEPSCVEAARRTVDFIFRTMFRDGHLLHVYKDGQAKLRGYLDDYAFVALGLLDLYEALFDRSFIERASDLVEMMLREFWDERGGGLFYTGKSHEPLISRAKPVFDASIPSGNAIAAQLLLRFYYLIGREEYRTKAETILRSYYDPMVSQPFGFAHMLCALDQYLHRAKEIVLVGEKSDARTVELIKEIHSLYLPNKALQLVAPDEPLEKVSPLLAGKTQIDNRPTVYVCQNFTCSAPVMNWAELKPLLET